MPRIVIAGRAQSMSETLPSPRSETPFSSRVEVASPFPGMIPARFRRPRCQRAGRMLADHDRAAQHSVRGLGDEIIPEPVALIGADSIRA